MSWIELVRWHLDSQYYRERKRKKSLLLLRYIGEPSLFIFIYFLFLFYYYTFLFFLYISSYGFFFYFASLVLSRIRPSVERLTRRPPSPHELFTPQRALGDGANDDRKGSTPELYRFSPAPVETSSNPAQVKQYIYWIYKKPDDESMSFAIYVLLFSFSSFLLCPLLLSYLS
jgi:hypothetical protein